MQKFKKVFEAYSKYYNLIYQNKSYKTEVNYIHKLISKFNYNNKNILEFGSGTGGHAKFFVDKGYTVHGIEKSKSMIANCKKRKGFTFQNGDVCKIRLKKKYDIVLSLFHVLSYQVSETNVNNFFKNARYHLKLNGLFGFDFWYTNAVNTQKPQTRLLELKKKDFKLIRLAEPSKDYSKDIISVNYTVILKNLKNNLVNVIKENHKMRHFSLTDLSRLCNKYRFKFLHVRELISNNKPSKNTWGVFCLLRKY
jgi:cyclopropane fatty-acyl-phospholipid synthase-like methyltransferase